MESNGPTPGDPSGLRALGTVIEEAWDALWGLITQTWWEIWDYLGGWAFFGPVAVVLFGVALLVSSDKQSRGNRRRQK